MLNSFKNYFGIGEFELFEEFKTLNKSSKRFLKIVTLILGVILFVTITSVSTSANSLDDAIEYEEYKRNVILEIKYNISQYEEVRAYQYKGSNKYNRFNMYNDIRDYSTWYKLEELHLKDTVFKSDQYYLFVYDVDTLNVIKAIPINFELTLKQKIALYLEMYKFKNNN